MDQYYDVFISYGRADSKDFASKLYEKLRENGLKVWFDQNDIPLGVDFQNQIDDGITKADNFLFIIAPHSVNSPYCLKEIELAVKYKKRIVPLLQVEQIPYEIWQQRNPQKTLEDWEIYQQKGLHSSFPNMHPEISRINWVYCRENLDNFETSCASLIELFHNHQDFVKQHSHLLVKGLEWEKNHKQTRYLLIGKERLEAEKWLKLKFKDEQAPCIPTDLHCEFICESNKNANNLMTQVFLAFSEVDKAIMQTIKKTLMREGITVWNFQNDLPTGKDFQIEIKRGIARADNLIYLLSPDAIKSEYCQQEIAYALSLNKRIIPVLIGPTNLTEIPTEIRHLQFIDFTQSASENQDKLIKEIQSEAVYYQRHKVLLVKALKWLSQNRNPSILLRGYNLEKYRSWLELAEKQTVNLPTDLQREFIAESAKQPPNLVLDVFVSYSRADADFARQLNEALQTQGKTTWFDQESIATGTDFQQEISQGIQKSDNFLFIISPDSVNSRYCADEVEYAKSLNKRFVTVLHRKVNTAELHPELAKVQWLDFNRYEGDFFANFSELVRTLDTDREYVREHTQMSQKALEWQRDNKNTDLLLRESKYVKAYEWLQWAQTHSKQPAVTEEIKEFILKSKALVEKEQKQKQWQRQRTIIGMAASSLIISVLGVRSEMERRKAVINERKAEIKGLNTRIVSGERTLDIQLAAMKLDQQANESREDINTTDLLQQTVNWQGYKQINSLEGHGNRVNSVAFSLKRDLIASASQDNTVKLWKPDGTLVQTLSGHEDYVLGVAFSPKGDLIASASQDKTVKLWKPDGTLVQTLRGHEDYVMDVAFSPKGDLIASASQDNTVKLWKPDGTLVQTLRGHEDYVMGVAFSPKGDLIASASYDKTVKLWKPDGTLVQTLKGHKNYIYDVVFNAKGNLIASASSDNTVKLWKLDGTLVQILSGHENFVVGVAFSPKGDLLASASQDNTVKLWKPDGTLVHTLIGHEKGVNILAFSPKGDLIASASHDNTVKLWKPDGTLVQILNGHENSVIGVAFSPKGDLIASASIDNTVKLWKPDGTLVQILTGHEHWVWGVAFSPKGDLLASASRDNTVKLWKPDGTLVQTLTGHENWVNSVAFSPKGDLLASASRDNTVKLWKPDGT
ncbi:MAG: TIR domain-containing protein, partial [Microcoleaceae cyanobacterium MO_207.B10]|nr:TIR domain-containing protein [Microcoleaceae cyanobacterium MO_207.B10]